MICAFSHKSHTKRCLICMVKWGHDRSIATIVYSYYSGSVYFVIRCWYKFSGAAIAQRYNLSTIFSWFSSQWVCSAAAIYLLLLSPHGSSIETEKLYPAIFLEWALSESGLRGLEAIKGIVQSAFRPPTELTLIWFRWLIRAQMCLPVISLSWIKHFSTGYKVI